MSKEKPNEFDGYTWGVNGPTYEAPAGVHVCANCRFSRLTPEVLANEEGELASLLWRALPDLQCRHELPPWLTVMPSAWCRMWEKAHHDGQ